MSKYSPLILILLISGILGTLIFRSCRYDWNPHYIGNKDVTVDRKLYSPDRKIAVVYYTLDVGVRGTRSYKSLLADDDYDNDLIRYTLPPEIVVLNWAGNRTLNVRYDPNEIFRLGGSYTEIDFSKDTIVINGVSLINKKRINENRDSVFYENSGKYQ
ncbi:hypothetical protein [Desertivirga arenae]|uniref:hypothetical protein n=1 Tax=Desertivirga arenae TaxID=2810309 RepID=UPI001A9692E9|nr:hypothetical protein [Pedobacter sp. SYSU D00823]